MAAKYFNLKAFVIAGLRRLTYKYPPRYNCMNSARTERGKYKCAQCKAIVGRKDIKIDHIIPVVGVEGFIDWNTYIPRMFCNESNFQALCDTCHKAKTKQEKSLARKKRIE